MYLRILKPWTHDHFVLALLFATIGIKGIDINKFLLLVGAGKIANPVIAEDIRNKITSDDLARAILVRLFWFITRIDIVRVVSHLAVTLVGLNAGVCMALLTLPLISFFWREKPFPWTSSSLPYTISITERYRRLAMVQKCVGL